MLKYFSPEVRLDSIMQINKQELHTKIAAVHDLYKSYAQIKGDVNLLQRKYKSCLLSLKTARTENQTISDSFTDTHVPKQAHETVVNECKELQSQYDNLKRNYDSLINEHQVSYQSTCKTLNDLQRDNTSLKEKCEKLKSQNQFLEKSKVSFNKQLEENEGLVKRLKESERTCAEIIKEKNELKRNKMNYKELEKKYSALLASRNETTRECEQLHHKLQSLNVTVKELQQSKSEKEAAFANLAQENKVLLEKYACLKNNCLVVTKQRDDFETKVKTLENKCSGGGPFDLHNKYDKSVKNYANFITDLRHLLGKYDKIKEELTSESKYSFKDECDLMINCQDTMALPQPTRVNPDDIQVINNNYQIRELISDSKKLEQDALSDEDEDMLTFIFSSTKLSVALLSPISSPVPKEETVIEHDLREIVDVCENSSDINELVEKDMLMTEEEEENPVVSSFTGITSLKTIIDHPSETLENVCLKDCLIENNNSAIALKKLVNVESELSNITIENKEKLRSAKSSHDECPSKIEESIFSPRIKSANNSVQDIIEQCSKRPLLDKISINSNEQINVLNTRCLLDQNTSDCKSGSLTSNNGTISDCVTKKDQCNANSSQRKEEVNSEKSLNILNTACISNSIDIEVKENSSSDNVKAISNSVPEQSPTKSFLCTKEKINVLNSVCQTYQINTELERSSTFKGENDAKVNSDKPIHLLHLQYLKLKGSNFNCKPKSLEKSEKPAINIWKIPHIFESESIDKRKSRSICDSETGDSAFGSYCSSDEEQNAEEQLPHQGLNLESKLKCVQQQKEVSHITPTSKLIKESPKCSSINDQHRINAEFTVGFVDGCAVVESRHDGSDIIPLSYQHLTESSSAIRRKCSKGNCLTCAHFYVKKRKQCTGSETTNLCDKSTELSNCKRRKILDVADIGESSFSISNTTDSPPPKRAKGMLKGKAQALLDEMLQFCQNNNFIFEIAQKFLEENPDFIAKLILEKVSTDIHDSPTKGTYPMEPSLTVVQRGLYKFLMALEKLGVTDVCRSFLQQADLYLRTLDSPLLLEPVARLYVAICKGKSDYSQMRMAMCAALADMGDLAVPYIFIVLQSWIEVLPKKETHSHSHLIPKVVVLLILLKNVKTPGYNLLNLRSLLFSYYGFSSDCDDSKLLFKELVDCYLSEQNECARVLIIALSKYVPLNLIVEETFPKLLSGISHTMTAPTIQAVITLVMHLTKHLSAELQVSNLQTNLNWLKQFSNDTYTDVIRDHAKSMLHWFIMCELVPYNILEGI